MTRDYCEDADIDRLLELEEEENEAKRLRLSELDELFPDDGTELIPCTSLATSRPVSPLSDYDFNAQVYQAPRLVEIVSGPNAPTPWLDDNEDWPASDEEVIPMEEDEELTDDIQDYDLTDAARGSRWVWTMFNYDTLLIARLVAWFKAIPPKAKNGKPNARCFIYGFETCPSTGKDHLQGFCIFEGEKKFATLVAFNKKINNSICWRPAKCLSNLRCSNYCRKGDQGKKEWKAEHEKGKHFGLNAKVVEWGDLELMKQNKLGLDMGKRTDVAACRAMILACDAWADVLANEMHMEFIAAHMQWAREIFMNRPIEKMIGFKFYQWEKDLMEDEMPYHPRKVLWYWSRDGNVGKSTFSRYLVCNHNALMAPNKTAEAAFLFNGQKIVLFDVSRSGLDYFNWDLLEQIKNGLIVNTKYVPMQKVFNHPTVIVFSNNDGEQWLHKLSTDRWFRHEITPEECVDVEYVPRDDVVGGPGS